MSWWTSGVGAALRTPARSDILSNAIGTKVGKFCREHGAAGVVNVPSKHYSRDGCFKPASLTVKQEGHNELNKFCREQASTAKGERPDRTKEAPLPRWQQEETLVQYGKQQV